LGHFLKIKFHRKLEGTPKTVHLVLRADGHWYALIVCQTMPQHEHLPSACEHPDIGIDVGLTSFLTDSEGHTIENPRFYRTSQKTLRRKQRQLSRRKKGSHRWRSAARLVAQTHLKINRQRRDHHFKVAKPYAEGYQRIVVEDLTIGNMVKNHHLAKSILDASWGVFLDILTAKAESAGHEVIRVNPRFTSQRNNTSIEMEAFSYLIIVPYFHLVIVTNCWLRVRLDCLYNIVEKKTGNPGELLL
jgi:putative transposase